MSETQNPTVSYESVGAPTAAQQQPWWIGSLICIFVAATSQFGMLELFGTTAYYTTLALLVLGIYLATYGLWKAREQTVLCLVAISLNALIAGIVVWKMMKG